MAMEDSRQEPNIKDKPIRSAATAQSHKMSTAPTDGNVDDKIFQATVLHGQPLAHQNSGDFDINTRDLGSTVYDTLFDDTEIDCQTCAASLGSGATCHVTP